MNKRLFRDRQRKPWGMALISILTIGLASMLSLASFAYLVVLLTRSEGFQKQREFLFGAAETGVEYAINKINFATKNGVRSEIEPSEGESQKITELPPIYAYPSEPSSKTAVRVFIRVKELPANEVRNLAVISGIYDPAFDPTLGPGQPLKFGSPRRSDFLKSYWKIIEVTASRGSYHSSIRAILRPTIGTSSPSATPILSNSILANSINIDGSNLGSDMKVDKSITVEGTTFPYKQYDATIISNGPLSIGKNTEIKANLQIAFPSEDAPLNVATIGDGSTIDGQLFTNSSNQNSLSELKGTSGENSAGSDKVLARADSPQTTTRQGANNFSPIDNTAAPASYVPASIPNTPSNADVLPAFSNDNSTSLSGIYKTPTISNNTESIAVTGPTEVFVEGTTGSTRSVDINAQYFKNNGSPTNLKIWYNGTKPIRVQIPNGSTFNGIVYAPNASVTVEGQGTYNGAIAANALTSTVSKFVMMPTTDLENSLGFRQQPVSGEPPLGKYQIVSWRQVRKRLID